MNTKKALLFHIETTRQRLEWAVNESKDFKLVLNISHALTQLYHSLYELERIEQEKGDLNGKRKSQIAS